jgi:hypothetical protein
LVNNARHDASHSKGWLIFLLWLLSLLDQRKVNAVFPPGASPAAQQNLTPEEAA